MGVEVEMVAVAVVVGGRRRSEWARGLLKHVCVHTNIWYILRIPYLEMI